MPLTLNFAPSRDSLWGYRDIAKAPCPARFACEAPRRPVLGVRVAREVGRCPLETDVSFGFGFGSAAVVDGSHTCFCLRCLTGRMVDVCVEDWTTGGGREAALSLIHISEPTRPY